jgi:hypothetical protein
MRDYLHNYFLKITQNSILKSYIMQYLLAQIADGGDGLQI